MSDGQDKSDDLIAELAKLMAQGASVTEGDRTAPRLVTSADADPVSAASVRLPGFERELRGDPKPALDLAVAAEPAPVMPPVIPAAPTITPATSPTAAFNLRLPGDAPTRPATEPVADSVPPRVAASPSPTVVLPVIPVEPEAPVVSIDPEPEFAPTPAPSVVAASWRSPAPSVAAPETPRAFTPVAPVTVPPPKPAPSVDFDFDFGLSPNGRSEPTIEGTSVDRTAPFDAPGVDAGDPIADLIAADLDAVPVAPSAPAARPLPFSAPSEPLAASRQDTQRPDPSAGRFNFAPRPSLTAATGPASAPADPLEEIRGLVGKVLDEQPAPPDFNEPFLPPASAAAPVVPPLTTGFAPRRASLKDNEPSIPSAEAAILAASAAAGGEPPRLDLNSPAFSRPKARPERASSLRPYIGLAVAGTLLVASGFGLYWVLGLSRPASTDVPVIAADATPVKEAAPAAAPAETADQGAMVFNQLDGNALPAADAQLVSRDQSASVAEATTTDSTGDTTELANRKVRTVTVRPDGSIVSGDDAVAGTEALPIDRPNVPDLPGEGVQQSDLLAATSTVEPTQPTAPLASSTTLPVPSDPANVVPGKIAPVPMPRPLNRSALAAAAPAALGTPAPIEAVAAPADGPIDLTGAAPQTLETAPAVQIMAPAQPVAAQPLSSGAGPYVQLSSQPTPADAEASLAAMQRKLGSLLGGRPLEVRRVDLGQKGVRYRVVLPTSTFQEATQVCSSFKANGTDCVPING
jgi:hypothetical protein